MLRSLWNSGQNIVLPSFETLILGRNPTTGVTSLKCSKRQVCLLYDKNTKTARLKSLGKRRAVLNGQILESDKEIVLKSGDVFELLPGKFGYRYEDITMDSKSNPTDSVSDAENSVASLKSTEPEISSKKVESGWKSVEHLLIFNSPDLENRPKIASFDLDGTLIATHSGARFAKDDTDWRILFPKIPEKLKQLNRDGYKIVLFTNQKGLSLGYHTETGFKTKIERIQSKLDVPLQCFVSMGDGFFRKPLTGMWDRLEKEENKDVAVDRTNSFYVGDAAGRNENAKRKKDHSCADRLFALNLNLKFYTPEEFFLGRAAHSEPYSFPGFDPKAFAAATNRNVFEPNTTSINADSQEIVIMVGYPASGKSTFVETYLEPKGYVSISRDDLKSWKKCVAVSENLLKQGKSVVIDNTNPDAQSRARYLQLAKATANRKKLLCRCFWMNVDLDQARHNNKFRQLAHLVDANHKGVTDMILYGYRKHFQEPSTTEGFDEVVRVNFIPKFDDKQLENLYSMYLLEK